MADGPGLGGSGEHPVSRVVVPVAGALGLVSYGALYLAALAFCAPFGAVPEDAGLTQAVLLVRLVVLLSALVVLVLALLVLAAVVLAAVDGVRRLTGRPRLDLARRPGPRTTSVAVALATGAVGSAPWDDGSAVEAVVLAVVVLAAAWVARRVGGRRAWATAVLASAAWAGAAFALVGLGEDQADQLRTTGTWDEAVTTLGVYPGYAYLGDDRGGAPDTPGSDTPGSDTPGSDTPGSDAAEPYVSLGDTAGVFVLFRCRDASTVRVSTATVSVVLVPSGPGRDAARDRCATLLAGR